MLTVGEKMYLVQKCKLLSAAQQARAHGMGANAIGYNANIIAVR
jgi:hypothetical protein